MRGKGRPHPFPVTLTLAILLFGRKKKTEEDVTQGKPNSPSQQANPSLPVPDGLSKTVTESDMAKSRDRLRVASLERDIIGDALTKIYEAEARGQINDVEKGQLLQKYKVDLKRVDGDIDIHKRIVDLHELESAKEDLLKSFYEKLMEIDLRIGQLKPGLESVGLRIGDELVTKPVPSATESKRDQLVQAPTPTEAVSAQEQPPKEKPVRERPKSKAEERLEAVREEVLKAMERLEQIETEG